MEEICGVEGKTISISTVERSRQNMSIQGLDEEARDFKSSTGDLIKQ
jgi:hypothetical protein